MAGRALILVENLSVPFDRRVWQEATALREDGWEVHVVCPTGTTRDTEREITIDGVHILRYPLKAATGGPVGFVTEYGTALLQTVRLALSVRRRFGRIDVVHACNPPDVFFVVGLLLKLLGGSRFVFDQHDLVPELYESRFARGRDLLYRAVCLAERLTYATADVVVATNESYRTAALTRGRKRPERVFVVRSAPQVERFRPTPPDPALKQGKPYLLGYVGVMGPQDGIDYALRALASLRDTGRDDWHAVFLGSGDCFDEMVALRDTLGLADRVTFTGRVSDEDLTRWLSTADVCLAPDPKNPLNDVSTMNKIMEYMAMSRPIVSFDLREARVSAGDAALYATPNDVVEFGALVARLLDDPDARERMGEIGRARVEGPLSWKHSAEALLDAYRAATG
ncbi:glycosyltransferase family 4 protein [Pseudonocardia sp.]|uniref:glycosyltransferase family 4 protein n=1 Tax=Pseudonocardia sp. TaxID=60912 RepID=UPI003D0B3744